MKDKLFRAIDRLPNSTNAIRCRWFQVIMLMSLAVIVWALATGPGSTQTVGLCIAFLVSGFVIGARDFSTLRKDCAA